jgi:hypothetical protein
MNDKQNKFSLKYILSDTNLIRDVKTIAAFLLAYVVAVVSNGLIDGFSPAALISVVVGLGAFGTFFAVKIVTNEFTDRGMFDEEQTNPLLQKRLEELSIKSQQVNASKAYDILVEYNKTKVEYLKKIRFNELTVHYETELKRIDSLIEHAKITRKLKWFNRINKWYMSKLNARKRNVGKKLANLSLNTITVQYKPLTLQQLRVANVEEKEDKYNEAQRLSVTPQRKVRSQMAVTNFIKTFFFVGFQGAAIATVSSWTEFFIFLLLITLTLASTALTSYIGVRRYANFNYLSILDEKLEKLTWLIEETKKSQEIKEDEIKSEEIFTITNMQQ